MIAHDNLLTVAQVARRLQVHEITVRRYIRAGTLKAVRVGRNLRVREEDLERFLQPATPAGVRLPYRWPPTPEEMARRSKIIKEMLAIRAQMKPLDMSTTELVREGRRERDILYGRE